MDQIKTQFDNWALNPKPPAVYALLIGINDYQINSKLRGALHDVEVMREYLDSLNDSPVHLLKLTDADASKHNIIQKGFKDFLHQAQPHDAILIYFSGHGAQEEAAFYWDETDGKLECLVCYEEPTHEESSYLLADKEIRYLLTELSQQTRAHITVLMDCCHSGDNTRATSDFDVEMGNQIRVKSASGVYPQRAWDDFIFGSLWAEPKAKFSGEELFSSDGGYIQLSACESDQQALEQMGEGVFTKNLVQILSNSDSTLSYANLFSRLSQRMRFGFNQNPRMYASYKDEGWRFGGFLNREPKSGGFLAELSYNTEKGWLLNKGLIHNVGQESKLKMVGSEWKEAESCAPIREVYIDYAILGFMPNLDKSKVYRVEIEGLLSRKIHLELQNTHGRSQETERLLDELNRRAQTYFDFGPSENKGDFDYALSIRNGDCIISYPHDLYRPLIKPFRFIDERDVNKVAGVLVHIAQWHFIKELTNESLVNRFAECPIELVLEQIGADGQVQPLSLFDHTVVLESSSNQFKLRLGIKNISSNSIYLACLYLSRYFGSSTDMIYDEVHKLEAGETIFLGDERDGLIHYALDEVAQLYNWEFVAEHFQFLVSEEIFDIQSLNLAPLPEPDLPKSREGIESEMLELRSGPSTENEIKIKKWQTYPLCLKIKNSRYNCIDSSTLKAFLEDEATAEFAAGIYYKIQNNEYGQPVDMVLGEEIIMDEMERGLWTDVLIWGSNQVETQIRKRMYKRLKSTNRLRIVAEGDSWFQYPLILKDILDHLYKYYAIRSFAEAGDTLENYLKKSEYIKGVMEEKPKFFLVSGGGNDMLGEQFQYYLNEYDEVKTGQIEDCLNRDFYDKIEELRKWYETMFDGLLKLDPSLKILTHSYDYIIPIDTNEKPKKKSWLGVYMIQKKIAPQSLREKLIVFIVDRFNEMLQSVVKKYPGKVFYIDVRGVVPRNGWHDEIHPTNKEYEKIANEFRKVIERNK